MHETPSYLSQPYRRALRSRSSVTMSAESAPFKFGPNVERKFTICILYATGRRAHVHDPWLETIANVNQLDRMASL